MLGAFAVSFKECTLHAVDASELWAVFTHASSGCC